MGDVSDRASFERALDANRVEVAHLGLNKGDRARQKVCWKSEIAGAVMENADIELDDAQSTCVSPPDTLEKARELMTAGGFRRLPLVEGDKRRVGMISGRDVRQHLGYLDQTRINAAMASSPISISEYGTAESAVKLMLQHKTGGLPVINGGQVVGIVTTTDLLKALLKVVQGAGDILDQ